MRDEKKDILGMKINLFNLTYRNDWILEVTLKREGEVHSVFGWQQHWILAIWHWIYGKFQGSE